MALTQQLQKLKKEFNDWLIFALGLSTEGCVGPSRLIHYIYLFFYDKENLFEKFLRLIVSDEGFVD